MYYQDNNIRREMVRNSGNFAMNSGRAILCLLVALFTACSAVPVQTLADPIFVPKDLVTVKELDASKYVGRWYQMYGNEFGFLIYPRDSVCITADYRKINDTAISIYNANRRGDPDGPLNDIRGIAYRTAEPGKLKVRLERVSYVADYWVIKLGPVNSEGMYDYSIVSNRGGVSLFVLTRDPARFRKLYEQQVLAFLKEQKFTDQLTRPVLTYQGADCVYAPKPAF